MRELERAPAARAPASSRTAAVPPTRRRGVLALQRAHGNRYVARALAGGGGTVTPEIEEGIERTRRAGTALPADVRETMEGALGADLAGVRVHTGPSADRLAASLGARAFTTGSDVYFRTGAYDPSSAEGRELLAHELAHVVQQASGIRRALVVDQPGDAFEQEAKAVAREVAGAASERRPAHARPLTHASRDLVQRDEVEDAEKLHGTVTGAYSQAKELWGHVESGFGPEREKEEPEHWADESKELVRHGKQVLGAAKLLFDGIHGSMIRAGDTEGAKRASDLAKHFDKGEKLLGTGGKALDLAVKAESAYNHFTAVRQLIDDFAQLDIRSDPDGAARAFDRLFTELGKLGTDFAPGGPWKAYFEFLTHFGDGKGFFANLKHAVRAGEANVGERRQLRELGIDPEKETRFAAERRPERVEPVPFDDLKADVEANVLRAEAVARSRNVATGIKLTYDLRVADLLDRLADARSRYFALNVVTRQFSAESRALRKEIAELATAALEYVNDMERIAVADDLGVSFRADIAGLERARTP